MLGINRRERYAPASSGSSGLADGEAHEAVDCQGVAGLAGGSEQLRSGRVLHEGLFEQAAFREALGKLAVDDLLQQAAGLSLSWHGRSPFLGGQVGRDLLAADAFRRWRGNVQGEVAAVGTASWTTVAGLSR